MTVAVVVDECTARPPAGRSLFPKPGLPGDICKGPVTIIAVKAVLAEVGHKDVIESVIVVVGNAYAARPARELQAGFLSDVGKGAVAIVLVKTIGGFSRSPFKASSGKQKDIHPAVVVIIDEGTAAAIGFQDVFLA